MSLENLKITLTIALMGIVVIALLFDRPHAGEERAQATAERMAQAHLQPANSGLKQISVTFTMTAPLRQFYHGRNTTFESMRLVEEWSMLETQDIVLINNDLAGAQLCPEAFAEFMTSFADKKFGSLQHVSHGMAISAIRDIATRMHGKTAPVNVRIPLFDGRPNGLENCPDFEWLEKSHRLSYRGKPVAVMMAEQPQLGLAH